MTEARLVTKERLEAALRNADLSMRDDRGRMRTRTSHYWRDMAELLFALVPTLGGPAAAPCGYPGCDKPASDPIHPPKATTTRRIGQHWFEGYRPATAPAVIEGYVNPDGSGEGNWTAAAPAEGPCRFRKGRCITHGWEGPSHERKQVWCCPEFWTRAALARHESESE